MFAQYWVEQELDVEELNHTSTPSESEENQIEEANASQEASASQETSTSQEASVSQEASASQETSVSQEASVSPETPASQEVSVPQEASASQETPTSQEPETMETASWEDQLEESLSGTTLKRGELREGTIIYRRNEGFVVDIGAKRDGFVPAEDLKEIEGREFSIGDDVPVVVTNFRDSDGNVELSISQALLQEDWLTAEKLLESQEVYESRVTGSNRGGLTVEFGRLRGFVPMSQLIGFNRIRQPAERQRRLQAMVDEQIMLKVIEVNRRRRRLIMSQRAAAREWRAARRETLMDDLEAGQVRRGRISQITDFGLFVNLGGMDGLVHISELSWGRIESPVEVFHPGQRIKVKVLSVDQDRQRIALSIKALTPDPWESVSERYDSGLLADGKVTQVVDFGVFVELEPGIEGLLHNSELRDIAQREELSSGDSILVKVIRIESDRRRIGLSVRQVRPEEWEEWALRQIEEEQEAEAAEEELDDDDLDDIFDVDDDDVAEGEIDLEAESDIPEADLLGPEDETEESEAEDGESETETAVEVTSEEADSEA
jgi:small subunit ribosomal protein S1